VKTQLLKPQEFSDDRGVLVVCELPFDAKRVFWMKNVPRWESRGEHAMKTCQMILVAIQGFFDVVVENDVYYMGPDMALYIAPEDYRAIENFDPDAICLVLASEHFDEEGYK
jgi:hypothetical protein